MPTSSLTHVNTSRGLTLWAPAYVFQYMYFRLSWRCGNLATRPNHFFQLRMMCPAWGRYLWFWKPNLMISL